MRTLLLLALLTMLPQSLVRSATPSAKVTLPLWPGTAPGNSGARGQEHKVEGRPRPFYQLTGISNPSLEIFAPTRDQQNGTAILVCPGGDFQSFVFVGEPLQSAARLNTLGITACVLKYRTPAPAQTALLDAQRAMGLIRKNAASWQIEPDSVGVMGFSAGGEIAAWLMTQNSQRNYDRQDDADDQSCRPDFSVLIYAGGLLERNGTLKTALSDGLKPGIAPVFITHAYDDGCENSLQLALKLKQSDIPCELHLFQSGAHGFGVRKSGLPVSDWITRFVEWLRPLGHLDPAADRALAAKIIPAVTHQTTPPSFTALKPEGTLADAYRIQDRVVRAVGKNRVIAGFKAGAATETAQSSLGIDRPFFGILFRDGWLKAADKPVIEVSQTGPLAVETEIGFLMGTDFSGEILTDEQARDFVAAIVPVVELPVVYPGNIPSPSARDMVAINTSSGRYLVGPEFKTTAFDADAVPIRLTRDGQTLHETSGGIVKGGQWHNLRQILNSVTAQGHTIPAGSLVICGALGKAHPGVPGKYEAHYGPQTVLQFEIR